MAEPGIDTATAKSLGVGTLALDEEVDEEANPSQEKQDIENQGNGLVHTDASTTGWMQKDVYDYALNSLESSFLVYSFTDLRQMVKDGLFSSEVAEEIMAVPIKLSTGVELLWRHRQSITTEWGNEETELFTDMMDDFEKTFEDTAVRAGYKNYLEAESNSKTRIESFCDETKDKDCVHAIVVNGLGKVINVTFRGTKTFQDLLQDTKLFMKKTQNPLAEIEGQPKHFMIHNGFSGYLYGRASNKTKGDTKGSIREGTMCQTIIDEILRILDERPGYKIMTTGHSLGGSLAALFAFEVASLNDPRICKPVTCISVAAPRVGNNDFRKAFSYLEEKGNLRYLRVENDLDIVTMYPWTSMGPLGVPVSLVLPNQRYRHVGIQLKLYEAGHGFQFCYSPYRTGFVLFILDFWSSMKRLLFLLVCCVVVSPKEIRYHHCGEYRKRLMAAVESLKGRMIEDFYTRISEGDHGVLYSESGC